MQGQIRNYIVPTRKLNVIPVYKQTPRRIPKDSSALDVAEKKLFEKYDPTGAKRALFDKSKMTCPKAGDILRVVKKDKSTFVGMLLALNRNHVASTILLRTKIGGVGVENRFHIFNPHIERIEILRVPAMRWPKEKYYFVRGSKKYDSGDLDSFVRRQQRARR